MIELKNICFKKDNKLILNNINIKFDETRFYVITGPNGSGKSTLAKVLMGIEKADAGQIILDGEGASGRVVSRSVAQDNSVQVFYPQVQGDAPCFGHVQCDSIIMGNAKISSIPAIVANHVDAQLIHEAAIGRIAGDQILKLMTLGLTAEEAEEKILEGFLR